MSIIDNFVQDISETCKKCGSKHHTVEPDPVNDAENIKVRDMSMQGFIFSKEVILPRYQDPPPLPSPS